MAKKKNTGFTFSNPSNFTEKAHNFGQGAKYYTSPDGIRSMFDNLVKRGQHQARHAPGGMSHKIPASELSKSTALVPAGTYTGAGAPAASFKLPVSWNKNSGLSLMGKNVGKAVPYVAGGISALQAIGGLNDLTESRETTDDLVSQIIASASGNPYTAFDLTSDQKKLLRQLKRDGNSSDADLSDIDLLEVLKGAGMGGLGGLAGGLPGAIVGAIGGGVNAGIDSMNSAQVGNQAELEALLEALTSSEMNYKNMLRQRAYANF